MRVEQIQNITGLQVGDKVVSSGGGMSNPRYYREVLRIQCIPGHGSFAILAPSEALDSYSLITPNTIKNWWKVMPEPRTVKFKLWYRESDGSHLNYRPGDDNRHFRDHGYILIECEGKEVQS